MADQRPESGAIGDTRLLARIWDWSGQAVEPMDALAIARAATARVSRMQRRRSVPAWRFPEIDAQAKLAILAAATLVVAVAGISLLPADENVGRPTVAPSRDPMTSPNPLASAVTAAEFPSGLLTADIRYAMTRDTVPFSLVFPTSGWRSDGDFYIANPSTNSELFFWASAPDGVFADPCSATKGLTLTSNAELASAVASIPGTVLVSEPTDVTVGGLPAKRLELTVPGDIPCAVSDFKLWYAEGIDGGRYASRLDNTIRVWIIDAGGTRLWIDAETPANASPESEAEIQQVIDSIEFGLPFVPEAGDLQPGAYGMGLGLGLSFVLSTSDWVSGPRNPDGSVGPIFRGTVGSPDGAVIHFARDPIRRVFTDPCAHILGPAIGPSRADLATAIASIPGVDITGPNRQSLPFSTAEHLVLTVRDDIGCPPADFYLWSYEDGGIRAATALSSTIRVWIFNPNDRRDAMCCGRVVIEAETYAGANPEIERDIQRIVDSVTHGG